MDIALFILRILIVIALYTFLGVLLWTLLRQQAPDHSTGLPRARLIQITVAYDLPWHMSERVYDLKASAWMGRDPNCLVQIDDDFASARHAQVLWRADDAGWWVEDNLSRNGTFVNEERITRARLNDGDVIRVGRVGYRFQLSNDE